MGGRADCFHVYTGGVPCERWLFNDGGGLSLWGSWMHFPGKLIFQESFLYGRKRQKWITTEKNCLNTTTTASNSIFRKFRLVHQMEVTFSVWSDRNIRDHLWRWSTLIGPVISVGRTEIPLSNRQNCFPQYRSFVSCLHWRIISKRAVAWVGSVQPECTLQLGTWNFRNFKPELFFNGKRPRWHEETIND